MGWRTNETTLFKSLAIAKLNVSCKSHNGSCLAVSSIAKHFFCSTYQCSEALLSLYIIIPTSQSDWISELLPRVEFSSYCDWYFDSVLNQFEGARNIALTAWLFFQFHFKHFSTSLILFVLSGLSLTNIRGLRSWRPRESGDDSRRSAHLTSRTFRHSIIFLELLSTYRTESLYWILISFL